MAIREFVIDAGPHIRITSPWDWYTAFSGFASAKQVGYTLRCCLSAGITWGNLVEIGPL